jgi:glyoxylase-like metal-dependent hydrolase (beta-lactamase superfamily II)
VNLHRIKTDAAAALLLACMGVAPAAWTQQRLEDVEIRVLPVRDNIYMLVGEGGNITLQLGEDGVLIVDTQFAHLSGKILAAIRRLSDKPLRYIINTHVHPDHVGGNRELRAAGSTIAGGNISMDIGNAGEGAQIIAHENVLVRLSAQTGDEDALPPEGWPTSSYFTGSKSLYFNGEGIQILHQPAAHTDGDSFVYFRKSDVIAAGDVYVTTTYPYIDLEAGGSYQGIVDGLNRLIDLMVPVYGQDDGTLVIPGHGRLSDIGDVINYREMLIIIGDRIRDMISKGMSLKDVQAARPTRDYDPRWGATSGRWTTEKFIEAAYTSLRGELRP